MEKVILKRNGKLAKVRWDGKKQKYVKSSVKAITPFILHERTCELEEGVTLGDIFRFLNKNIKYWDMLVGNWCKDIVKEGLKPYKLGKEDSWVITEALELYWSCEVSKHTDGLEMESMDRPCFHGKGVYTKDGDYHKKGQKVNIAVEFTPTYELAPYPVVLDNTLDLWYWDYTSNKGPRRLVKKVDYVGMTLFQIIYGIIWELSFCGSPKTRIKKQASLMGTVKKLKLGPTHKKRTIRVKRRKNRKSN